MKEDDLTLFTVGHEDLLRIRAFLHVRLAANDAFRISKYCRYDEMPVFFKGICTGKRFKLTEFLMKDRG
jgi:hypothetical protein